MVDADARERDKLGRLVPHRMNMVILGRAIPGLLARFDRRVPDGYLERDDHYGARVNCPCGATPYVHEGESVKCECERIYLCAGDVHVANSPTAGSVGRS